MNSVREWLDALLIMHALQSLAVCTSALALSNKPRKVLTYLFKPAKQKSFIPAIKNIYGHEVTTMKDVYLVQYFKTSVKYYILKMTSSFHSLDNIRHFLLGIDVFLLHISAQWII